MGKSNFLSKIIAIMKICPKNLPKYFRRISTKYVCLPRTKQISDLSIEKHTFCLQDSVCQEFSAKISYISAQFCQEKIYFLSKVELLIWSITKRWKQSRMWETEIDLGLIQTSNFRRVSFAIQTVDFPH